MFSIKIKVNLNYFYTHEDLNTTSNSVHQTGWD